VATSRIVESVGRVLGGRYRLVRPLGSGASAHVFVADDVTLRRRVAVKVLHPALASDEAFLRRFEAEARVVAALGHPNILRVYDWGEDEGSPYLVMELLEGGSLRALLDLPALLSPAQAAAVGGDVARALAYAHRRGLVHRDIKPANLLFDDEGRVNVADFGLARALAEATWTEPAGAIVGTARYAAPEAVRGQSLGDRADIYALALVLSEATTGVVPFATDTTIGTLMARVERPLSVGRGLGPLGPALEAAGAVDPDDRPSAVAFAALLDDAASRLPVPAALTLAGPLLGGDPERDADPTELPGSRMVNADDRRPEAGDRRPADRPAGVAIDLTDLDDHRDPPSSGPPAERVEARDAAPGPPGRRRRWRRWALLVAVAALLGGVAVGAVSYLNRPVATSPVPSLTGYTQGEAAAVLAPLDLRLVVAHRSYDASASPGTILAQVPTAGRLRHGQPVTVTLSLGPKPVPVPSLANLPLAEAEAQLHGLGLAEGQVTSATSLTVPAGSVISSSPDHGTLLPGGSVDLVISTGKPTVQVVQLSGPTAASFAAAEAALAAQNLPASQSDEYSATVPKGVVIATVPPAGTTVSVGTPVTVVVSKGPQYIVIPQSVIGQSVSAATQTLEQLGLSVDQVDGNPLAPVVRTIPAVGLGVEKGGAVHLVTG
jgi:serine/threonine-protein kinase